MFLENITEQQIDQFRQAFALFDKDGDGSINNKQLKTVLRSLGHNPTKQQLDMFIALIDEDRSGTIDFREFLILISQRLNEKNLLDEIVETFKLFDKDQDGFLERSQCKCLFMASGFKDMDYVDQVLEKIDEECTGLVSCEKIVHFLLQKHIEE